MNRHERKIEEMISTAGGEQVRQRKHRVYRFADGRVFVRSSTPSDFRTDLNTISDLKKFLAAPSSIEKAAESTPALVPFEAIVRKRCFQLPNPAGQDGAVIIPALGKIDRKQQASQRRILSLDDLLTAADQVEDYWNLCSNGRVRVLQKLAASRFKTSVYTVISCLVGVKELKSFQAEIDSQDHAGALDLVQYLVDHYDPAASPALVIERDGPDQEPLLIECCASFDYNEVDQTAIAPLEKARCGIRYAIWPLPSAEDVDEAWEKYIPQQFCFFIALSPQEAKLVDLTFLTCAQWSDPAKIRPVTRKMLALLDDPQFAEARDAAGDMIPDVTAKIAEADEQFQSEPDENALDAIATPYLNKASEMVHRGMDGLVVSGGMVRALAGHILLTAEEYQSGEGEISEEDIDDLAASYGKLLKEAIQRQRTKMGDMTAAITAHLREKAGLRNIGWDDGNGDENAKIAEELLAYMRKNDSPEELIEDIETLLENCDYSDAWRKGLAQRVYVAGQMGDLDKEVALVFVSRVVSIIHLQKTGKSYPHTEQGKAILFEQCGLPAYAKLILTDGAHFNEMVISGHGKTLGTSCPKENRNYEMMRDALMAV